MLGSMSGGPSGGGARHKHASLPPPSERVFASLLDDRGLDRESLDMHALSTLSGTFSRSIGFFSLMQGGRNAARSREAALTGGRSALKDCDGFSLALAANQ